MEEKTLLSIYVTEEQKELLYAVWAHNDWEVEEVDSSQVAQATEELSDIITDYTEEQSSSEAECEHCLCRPCITNESNKQLWWEDRNHAPCQRNNMLRKPIYKRFWTMLLHRRVWEDPRYLARKQHAMATNPRAQATAGPSKHRRDIMPECVLKLVRGWYPNPPQKGLHGT